MIGFGLLIVAQSAGEIQDTTKAERQIEIVDVVADLDQALGQEALAATHSHRGVDDRLPGQP